MSDEARKIILARRARFMAAAMAGMGIAACARTSAPEPCLSVQPFDAESQPMPCLSPVMADAGEPQPVACLSVVVPPSVDAQAPPMPCLSVVAPASSASGGKPVVRDGGLQPVPRPGPPPMACLTPLPSKNLGKQ